MRLKLDSHRLLVVAALLALPALGLMALSVLVPRPAPVMLAMSVAQGLGALAFLLYLAVVLRTMRRNAQLNPKSQPPQSTPEQESAGDA